MKIAIEEFPLEMLKLFKGMLHGRKQILFYCRRGELDTRKRRLEVELEKKDNISYFRFRSGRLTVNSVERVMNLKKIGNDTRTTLILIEYELNTVDSSLMINK